LMIVGVVLAYLTTELLSGPRESEAAAEADAEQPAALSAPST
jgi:hypothetical protein